MKSFVALAVLFVISVAAFPEGIDLQPPMILPVNLVAPPKVNRVRRATTTACPTPTALTAAQQTETVNIHNTLRASLGAANMIGLVWDSDLAANAQAWASGCVWQHGGLTGCGAWTGQAVGQNMYVTSGSSSFPAINMTGTAYSWMSEQANWNSATSTCAAGAVCGHFTQLAWAQTTRVGCGVAQCPNMNVGGSPWAFAQFVVCDYYTAGNVAGTPVYLPGAPCSNCDSAATGQGYTCASNLCNPCAGPSSNAACTCGVTQTCQNGGTWNAGTCSCTCTKGWFGQNCANSCTCADSDPVNCPGYAAAGYCTNALYQAWADSTCMTSCQVKCIVPASCSS